MPWVTRPPAPVLGLDADAEHSERNRRSPDRRVGHRPESPGIPIQSARVLPQASPRKRRSIRRAWALATCECVPKPVKRVRREGTGRGRFRLRWFPADIRARASERTRPSETRSKRSRRTSLASRFQLPLARARLPLGTSHCRGSLPRQVERRFQAAARQCERAGIVLTIPGAQAVAQYVQGMRIDRSRRKPANLGA